MDDVGTDRGTIRFSRFTLDLDRGALLDGGHEVTLRPKSFEVLCHLVRHAGRLVSQKDLLDAVWGHTIVTEDSVRQCVADVRRAIGDDDHKVVRTVPRRGYIFDLPVAEPGAGAPPDAASRSGPAIFWRVAASLGVLLLALAALRFFGSGPDYTETPPVPKPPAKSIAVLRFADMSPAGDHAYLAAGLAEEILNRLAQSPALHVIARTSSFAVDGETIASVARQLNVAHVLEGSVRRSGDQIRVTVQLIDTATGAHIWSRNYDARFGDVIAIQSEIAEAVASHLDATLETAGDGGTTDALAFERALLARHHYMRRGPGDLGRAEALFREALEIDPEYADAWAGLAAIANVRLRGRMQREDDPAERTVLRKMQKHAIEQALRFGPRLADTQMRAAGYFWYSGDRERALEHLEIARKLDPDHWLVLSARASELVTSQRVDEAIEVMQQILQRDPLNAVNRVNLAQLYGYVGRLDDALAEHHRISELHPTIARRPDVMFKFAKTLLLLERYDEALGLINELPEGRFRNQGQALIQHATGAVPDAERALADLESRNEEPADMLAIAEVHAYRGDDVCALAWLQRLGPRLACGGEVLPRMAFYSPFIARLDGSAELDEWRRDAARQMAECRY